jgi:hypothetical protein
MSPGDYIVTLPVGKTRLTPKGAAVAGSDFR